MLPKTTRLGESSTVEKVPTELFTLNTRPPRSWDIEERDGDKGQRGCSKVHTQPWAQTAS